MYWTFCWNFFTILPFMSVCVSCPVCVCFVRFTTRSFASSLMLLWRQTFCLISFLIRSIFVLLWFFLPAPSQVWEQVGENTKPKITNHFQKSEKNGTNEKRTTNSILNHQFLLVKSKSSIVQVCVSVSVCLWYT